MNKDVLLRARWFSWRRQRLDRTCRGVEDCLRSVIGVYSVNPSGPLSLLARVPRLLKGAAAEGVIDTKRAVRIPAMRRSIYMVLTESAPNVFWATRQHDGPYRWLLSRHGIDDHEYARLRRQILLAAGFPKTVEQIREAIRRPPPDLSPVLQAMCAEGVLLRIKAPSIRSNALTYAATKVWLGAEMKEVPPPEALAWLAGEYLSAFGPATAEDFAWWTGLRPQHAAEAVSSLDTIDLGKGLLLHNKDERAFEGTRPNLGRVSLLPKWDCYTMGYASAGRARFAHQSLHPLIYGMSGDAQPVVLVEGEAQGIWNYRLARDHITIKLSMFENPGPRLSAALEAETELVGSFLEAGRTVIERARIPRPGRRRSSAHD